VLVLKLEALTNLSKGVVKAMRTQKNRKSKIPKVLQNNRRIGKQKALEKLAKEHKRKQDKLKVSVVITAIFEGDDELLDQL